MRPLLLAALLAVLGLAAGCFQAEPIVTQEIVSTIPWPDKERAEYILLDPDDGSERGRGVLSVTRQGEQYELRLRFEGNDASDESTLLVDATTLRPISMRREISSSATTITGDYDAEERTVTSTVIDKDGDERSLPLRLKEHYYDNESSLFLWRTIVFEPGYEASYHSVLVNQNSQRVFTIRVVGRQEITVPAGTFNAWRVEITSNIGQPVAWYTDTPEHLLLQFLNRGQVDVLLQLTALPD